MAHIGHAVENADALGVFEQIVPLAEEAVLNRHHRAEGVDAVVVAHAEDAVRDLHRLPALLGVDVETVRVVRPARFEHVAVGEKQRGAVNFWSGPRALEQAVVEREHGTEREHDLGWRAEAGRGWGRFAEVTDGRAFKRQRAARRANGRRLPGVPLAHRASSPMNEGVAVERRQRTVVPDLPPAVGEE